MSAYCTQRGCWESLCAGPAIERQTREADLAGSLLLGIPWGWIPAAVCFIVAGTEYAAAFQAAELPLRAYCPSNDCKKLALQRYRTGMLIPYRFSIERHQVSGKTVYEAKFCPFCGTELLTACPSCKKPILIEDPEQTNCIHCGKRIFHLLTTEQIDAIEKHQTSP